MEIKIAQNEDIEKVFALRREVFVCEQNVPPEIEIDEEDKTALHIIAKSSETAVACARLILSGNSAHIGRLAVKSEKRGMGIGSAVCRFIIDYSRKHGYTQIWLNSQLHATGFYESLGFTKEGGVFTEAGIEHIKMSISL